MKPASPGPYPLGLIRSGTLVVLAAAAIACNNAPTTADPLIAPTPSDSSCPSAFSSTNNDPSLPPISGGTLLVTHDDSTVVAADADRDSVWIVDTAQRKVRARLHLPPGSEPGRLVEDSAGKVHLALRRSGKVVQLDPLSGKILATHPVCPAPRGLAYDPASDTLHVACAGGELISVNASDGQLLRSLFVDLDLRDVVVKGDHLLISRFRSAELLELDASGALLGRIQPRDKASEVARDSAGKPTTSSPTTAWRLHPLPDGSVAMLHQRANNGTISVQPDHPGEYGVSQSDPTGACQGTSIVSTGVTLFRGAGTETGAGAVTAGISLAYDLAVSPDGKELALVGSEPAFGSPHDNTIKGAATLLRIPANSLTATDSCLDKATPISVSLIPGVSQAVSAAAYDKKMGLWLRTQDPAGLALSVPGQPLYFMFFPCAEPRRDMGRNVFHSPTGGRIACVSCHPEASDDHHTWSFEPIGLRRTQSLRGGILATAPFHWDGDLPNVSFLLDAVFVKRMSGPSLSDVYEDALAAWLDAQPSLPKSPPRDPQAVMRGQELFFSSATGCATCHSGPHFTNNLNADVGTGRAVQVPSLIDVRSRAPYMHTGCAATLRGRFEPACGGGDRHGTTAWMSQEQIDDLAAYLETL